MCMGLWSAGVCLHLLLALTVTVAGVSCVSLAAYSVFVLLATPRMLTARDPPPGECVAPLVKDAAGKCSCPAGTKEETDAKWPAPVQT